ncbi:TetR/AcrR family transcriptional regulator [Belnapia sp. T6]|uniref:TetR/AcrR family transcriptional regulator n=1 Tax=Belnapia mucosa TaxID=2804532 RepID=A0ABS1V2X7_9PROT|nr:TetR/AcrR family transcriptional regulator [Belnapia mucosa]MBL6454658.1 TetR/AcrR family transcriptional regulator [Belnapia mucosa]
MMSSATADRPKAAQRIQSAAKDLFYRHGIRATGIEEVCRAAEATKMSLYRSYPSKDALVAAILEEDAAAYDAWFAAATAGAATPAEKLQALAEAVADKLERPEYRGCPLLLAQAEFPDPTHPTHCLVAQHKTRMRQQFAALAREAGARDPDWLGDAMALLIDGAWSSLPYMGGARAAAVLRQGTAAILRASLAPA